jgi:hypothetical protein
MNIGLLRVKIAKVCRSRRQSDLQWQAEFQVDPSQCIKSFAIRKVLQAVVHLSFTPFIAKKYTPGFCRWFVFCSDRRYRCLDGHFSAFGKDRVLKTNFLYKMLFSPSVDRPFAFESLAVLAVYRPSACAGRAPRKTIWPILKH